ncbi:uncharacterized protein MELLADRAFT_66064 [Melampsora larici-populina 98AG31]|uniref:Uncharacterized protein n=1 Tax=Melampsora larici-populina (strain 98AG31 / pathotype 3-4-7) TaxID=747676 RepID=F4RXR1_MELLP|nr:uncharacterized protein MELLADRAFT_66064 [Melampsora larici-populina 98AG31]EGG02854.1 hypothetical protein MELLADRAFT_66064 [Melampsora larici-populina 98AG31]
MYWKHISFLVWSPLTLELYSALGMMGKVEPGDNWDVATLVYHGKDTWPPKDQVIKKATSNLIQAGRLPSASSSLGPSGFDIPHGYTSQLTYKKKLPEQEVWDLPPMHFVDYVASFDPDVNALRCRHQQHLDTFLQTGYQVYSMAVKSLHNRLGSASHQILETTLEKIKKEKTFHHMSEPERDWYTKIFFILGEAAHEASPIYEPMVNLYNCVASLQTSWYTLYTLAEKNLPETYSFWDRAASKLKIEANLEHILQFPRTLRNGLNQLVKFNLYN